MITKQALWAMTCVLLFTPLFISLPHEVWATDLLTPGGPCVTDPLSDYISTLGGTGCVLGDKTFSGFSYRTPISMRATPPAAADITVTPIPTPGNPGLTFAATWVALNEGSILESIIGYTVNVLPGGALIEDASLALTKPLADTFASAVNVTETLCLGGAACPTPSRILHGGAAFLLPSVIFDSTTFPPVGTVGVVTDILLGNGVFDTASLASVVNQFSEVTEPAPLLLLGSGLVGLAGVAWRKRRRNE